MKRNILVFPCGSEVALEIHRAMRYSTSFHLVGASSVADHGRFVYQDYADDVPFHTSPDFIDHINHLVATRRIAAIYPAMDAVAKTLKLNESALNCRVIGSSMETTAICASKTAIYTTLSEHVPCPQWGCRLDAIESYPVFIKPDEGYGGRGTLLAEDPESARDFIKASNASKLLFCEWLPGNEYTIDCFSDRQGRLLFVGGRLNKTMAYGTGVDIAEAHQHQDYFTGTAQRINAKLQPRGAWFFQMKEDRNGTPKLLETAVRPAGSSSFSRVKGVNTVLMSAFDAFDYPVSVTRNPYNVELGRALGLTFKFDVEYETAYVGFDNCILIDGKINTRLVAFLYHALNHGKRLVLVTRRGGDVVPFLKRLRIYRVFDDILHLPPGTSEAENISAHAAIFIDASHTARADVERNCGIPVFAPDTVDALLD